MLAHQQGMAWLLLAYSQEYDRVGIPVPEVSLCFQCQVTLIAHWLHKLLIYLLWCQNMSYLQFRGCSSGSIAASANRLSRRYWRPFQM
jgi:hypothetical protein